MKTVYTHENKIINAQIYFFLFDAVTSIVAIFVKFLNWSEQGWRSRILTKCSLKSIKMEMTRFNSMVDIKEQLSIK